MTNQSNSTHSNILLKNTDSDIAIALNFTTPPKVAHAEENQAANKSSTRKSSSIILDNERYIDEKYVTSNLKQELYSAIFWHGNVVAKAIWEECTATLKEQIDFLKNKVIFFWETISAKKMNW